MTTNGEKRNHGETEKVIHVELDVRIGATRLYPSTYAPKIQHAVEAAVLDLSQNMAITGYGWGARYDYRQREFDIRQPMDSLTSEDAPSEADAFDGMDHGDPQTFLAGCHCDKCWRAMDEYTKVVP